MKVTRKIWSNLLMIILLIGMCAYPNMQVSASGKLKLSYEKNSETIVGKYVVVCGEGKTYIYKKSNPKTEIRKIDSVGHVLNKKLYWLKGTKLYSYNFNTKKTNAVDINIEIDEENCSGLEDSEFLISKGNYLYYKVPELNSCKLYRIDVKSGKVSWIKGNYMGLENLGVYNKYCYLYATYIDDSPLMIYRLKLGDKKFELLEKNAKPYNVEIIDNKIYYLAYKSKGLNSQKDYWNGTTTYETITTTLYCCDLNGKNKKKLKTWKKQNMELLQCRSTKIFTRSEKTNKVYSYDLKTKKTKEVKKLAKNSGIKFKQSKYGSKKTYTISWHKNNIEQNVDIQITYATKKNFSDEKTLYAQSSPGNFATLKNFVPGKTYYIKLRACSSNWNGSKYIHSYSPYSKVYKIKVKK